MFGIDDAVLFTAGAKMLGGFLDNQAAADRQDSAQAFSAQQYATRYQTQVADMKAAGLNPMLAYTQAPGNSPGGVVSSPSNNFSSAADSITQSRVSSAQVANTVADTRNKEAQTANIEADTELKRAQKFLTSAQEGLAGASADQTRVNINYLEFSAKKISEEIKNIPTEGARLRALVENLGAEYKLIQNKTNTQEEATNQMKWLAVKTMLESDLAGFDVKAAESLGNLGRLSKEGKIALDILRMFSRK